MQGPTGIQGIQGSTGPQGPRGPPGNAGTQGILGPTGSQGIRGYFGPSLNSVRVQTFRDSNTATLLGSNQEAIYGVVPLVAGTPALDASGNSSTITGMSLDTSTGEITLPPGRYVFEAHGSTGQVMINETFDTLYLSLAYGSNATSPPVANGQFVYFNQTCHYMSYLNVPSTSNFFLMYFGNSAPETSGTYDANPSVMITEPTFIPYYTTISFFQLN